MKDGQKIGQWLKWDFKTNGYLIINDKNGKQIYFEDSDGFWVKWEYDSQGKEIYYENSDGKIIDKRTPEIIMHDGHKYQLIKQINPNETITLPTKWYILLTEENYDEVKAWWLKRVKKSGWSGRHLLCATLALSKHPTDPSHYWSGDESYFNERYPSYQKITLEQFRQITNSN